MRADGKPVKHTDPMYALTPYFMEHRVDSMNMITLNLPEEPLKTYMNKRRAEGKAVSHMALILAAYIQCLDEFPALNRFVMGRRVFDRNEISVSLVVLRAGSDNDTMSKLYFDPDDTIDVVQQKIESYIAENRKTEEETTLDKWIRRLTGSRLLCRFFIRMVKQADKWGLLPKSIIDASPFHASLLISNLASIRTNHIYHHVYEFGTTSISMTMGNLIDVPKMSKGQIVLERNLPVGLVMDERICNGHYFAMAFARMREYLSKPELLETPFSQKPYGVHIQK